MVALKAVGPEDKELLWNLQQKYLYEMTRFYDDEMDQVGNYHYGYFDAYFTDPERRALLIYNGSTLVGFAMIHPYSYVGEHDRLVLAEFTIFPRYRRERLAKRAVELIFEQFPGTWEIKYHQENGAARELWNKVSAKYKPSRILLGEEETVLVFRTYSMGCF